MHLLGISTYPVRWKRLLWGASLLNIVIALEGIGTLIWLLAHLSEPKSRVFLAYSLERLGLIVLTLFLLAFIAYLLCMIGNKHEQTLTVIRYFEDEERAAGLMAVMTIMVAAVLGLHIGLLSNGEMQAYYWQLFPILTLLSLTILQMWIFLLISFRQARIRVLKTWFPVYQEEQSYYKITERTLLISLIVISLFYLFAPISAGSRVPKAVELGDTTSYLEGAGMELSDPAFFSERRPWGILLVYKLLGGSLASIGIAQLAFSTIAWLFLAWMFVGSLRSSGGKFLGFVVILGISLSPTVQVWNHAGLSESFSITIMIIILALFTGLLQRWKWSFFLSLIFFFALWVSIHEVNLYLGLLVAITLLTFGLIRKNFRIFLVLAFSIAIMLVINSHLSSLYALPRWALPVAEVITKRILPVPEHLDYFSNHGMPVTPELMALSGRWAHSDNYAILNDLRLRKFSKWLLSDGKIVYAKFLVAHPTYTLTLPLVNIEKMLTADFSKIIPEYKPILPVIANELFFPIRWFWVYLVMSVPVFGLVLWKHRRETSRVFWLMVLFFVFSIPYLYLAWHGDALDLVRHAAIANIQFHLGVWLVIVFSLDNIFMTFIAKKI